MKKEQQEKLLELMREVVQCDKELREQYQMGDKFRFVRDRLQSLYVQIQESMDAFVKDATPITITVLEDETVVYVYLYNSHGLTLQTWQKMLNRGVFYDHSVNRPIYEDRNLIDSFIRNKSNKAHHGYLAVVIKKHDITKSQAVESLKDAIGNPLVKVREGCLKFEKLLAFIHNGHEYVVSEEGELIKKLV